MSLREAWKKHLRGDHITTEELDRMIHQLDAAMAFMSEHPDFGLAVKEAARLQAYLGSIYLARTGRHACSLFRVAKNMGREIGVDFLACGANGMRFFHPQHKPEDIEFFQSDLRTCRILVKQIGDGCYVVNADTLERAEDP